MNQKIVVIEDSMEVSESIASILKLGNYQVLTANNGKQGIELVKQNNPDLVLCDIMMPELDGYGVLHILSKDPVTARIPFIYLTAKTDQRDFRTGMDLGADDYITKPFDGFQLLKVIELRLKKNDLVKTTYQNNISEVNAFFDSTKKLPDFQKLSDIGKPRLYKKKEFVYMEGQPQTFLYLIANGQVKTFKSNKEGKELITGWHGEGEFIGFVPLLENRPNNESAIVMKESEIYLIPQQDFITLISNNKEIAKKFISMLSSDLYEAENVMFDLAYQSVRQRVATVLVKLDNHDNKQVNGEEFIITVSRKDMSKMVGTSTESLNRTLGDFKDESVIEILDNGIKIIDRTKLERARK